MRQPLAIPPETDVPFPRLAGGTYLCMAGTDSACSFTEGEQEELVSEVIMKGGGAFCDKDGKVDKTATKEFCKNVLLWQVHNNKPICANWIRLEQESNLRAYISDFREAGALVQEESITDSTVPVFWTVTDPKATVQHTDYIAISSRASLPLTGDPERLTSISLLLELRLPIQINAVKGDHSTPTLSVQVDGITFSLGPLRFWHLNQDDILELAVAIQERNNRLGLAAVEPATLDPKAKKEQIAPRTQLIQNTHILFNADRIGLATIYALSNARSWKPYDGFAIAARPTHLTDVSITVGLPNSLLATTLWNTLSKSGPTVVKAHFVLWAMYYENDQTDVTHVQINQFCEWMGYKKHHKGGFSVETKQEARAAIEALTQMQIRGSYRPGKGKPEQRLTGGRLWDAVLHEQSYSDLFGQVGEGDPKHWEPLSFAFRPGLAQLDKNFRAYNDYTGRVATGLLKIPNSEEWALLIGGYLAFQDRINGHKPFKLRISTILAAIQRGQSDDRRRRTEAEARFWRSLDVLKEYGVIAGYQKPNKNSDPEDIADFDDSDEIAAYFNEDPQARTDWRADIVLFTMPNELDMHRLDIQRKKAIDSTAKQTERKRGRPKKISPVDADKTHKNQ